MLHLVKDILDRTTFDGFAGIHYANPVTGFQNQSQIVRYEQHRCAVFLAKVFDQFNNSRFDGHIKRRCWFIQNQQGRFRHQRHRYHNALLLPARQLMRK